MSFDFPFQWQLPYNYFISAVSNQEYDEISTAKDLVVFVYRRSSSAQPLIEMVNFVKSQPGWEYWGKSREIVVQGGKMLEIAFRIPRSDAVQNIACPNSKARVQDLEVSECKRQRPDQDDCEVD